MKTPHPQRVKPPCVRMPPPYKPILWNAVRDQWYNELDLDFDEAVLVYWGN